MKRRVFLQSVISIAVLPPSTGRNGSSKKFLEPIRRGTLNVKTGKVVWTGPPPCSFVSQYHEDPIPRPGLGFKVNHTYHTGLLGAKNVASKMV